MFHRNVPTKFNVINGYKVDVSFVLHSGYKILM